MPDRFETTRWSLVLTAAAGTEQSREALEWLCSTYWYPLYAYVRHRARDAESARDLTQSFFLNLLARESLRSVDPSKGRFRVFLLASIKHFLSNERARAETLRRRADHPAFLLPLDVAEERLRADAATGTDPEQAFETRWAHAVLDRALTRLGAEFDASGKADLFRHLSGHLAGGDAAPYDRIALELEMNEGALRVALHRMRRRLGSLLRQEVAQTVASDHEVESEIRNLVEALGRA